MKKQSFGTTKDGKETSLYTLSNQNGMEISVTDYGGIGSCSGQGWKKEGCCSWI